MPRRALAVVLLTLAALVAIFAARPEDDASIAPTDGEAPAEGAIARAPRLAAAPRGIDRAPDAERTPSPWWIEADIESLDPSLRVARIEAHWWPSQPPPSFEAPSAVFTVDVPIVEAKARARVPGDARPGWVVLFVVEGDRRRLAYPWVARPADEVRPGFGYGPIAGLPVLVGARSLRLRLVDREDLPVADLLVDVRDPERDLHQVQATGPDGRVRFDALRATEVSVGWDRGGGASASTGGRWPERNGDPYLRAEPRPVRVDGGEVVLRVPRRALLRVRGRVPGVPDDAWLAVDRYGLSTNLPGHNLFTTASHASHGKWVDPGRYLVQSVATPELAADQETTVELPMTLLPGDGWLDVGFDVRGPPGDDRLACAVEARRLREAEGWAGGTSTAPHDRALLLLPEGPYEVNGAVRVGGAVRCSTAQRVEVRAGEGTSITLATRPAGTLRLAGPYRGRECEVVERPFRGTGDVAAKTFRFAAVSWPQETTNWWLAAGSYVLRQFDDDEPGSERRLSFEVREGTTTELTQDAAGWFRRLPP